MSLISGYNNRVIPSYAHIAGVFSDTFIPSGLSLEETIDQLNDGTKMENPIDVLNLDKFHDAYHELDLERQVEVLNEVRKFLHELSPFKSEPVDLVQWVRKESVGANDYNPNAVAPPEMELLRHSIMEDGYTQPIVGHDEEDLTITVVDGFHRSRVGKECDDVERRVHGYLPVVSINDSRKDRGDRIAATIRHNRARGKHKVDSMSDIVVELKKRNWSDKKIGKELGMDEDEVLRLTQITGLAEMFADRDFSLAWEAELPEDDTEENIT